MKTKYKMKYSIIQSIEGNKHMQVKWKGNGTIWELSHVWLQAMKVGTGEKSLSIPKNLQSTVCLQNQISKIFPLQHLRLQK